MGFILFFFLVLYPCLPMVNVTSLQNFSSITQCLPSVPALAWSHTWCSPSPNKDIIVFLVYVSTLVPYSAGYSRGLGHSHSAGLSWRHKPATPWFSRVEWMWGFQEEKTQDSLTPRGVQIQTGALFFKWLLGLASWMSSGERCEIFFQNKATV